MYKGVFASNGWLTVLASVMLACVPASAQQKPNKPEIVRFVFGWKPGLRITVDSINGRQRSGQAALTSTVRHTMLTEAAGKALRVRFIDFDIIEAPGSTRVSPEELRSVVDLLASGVPDLLVDKQGSITRVEDVERLQETMRILIERSVSAEVQKQAGPAFRQLMQMVTAPALLEARAGDAWNPIVGAWAGSDLEVGATYVQEQKMPLPVLPGTELQMRSEFTVIGMEPCERHGKTRRCVVVQLRQVPEPKDLERVVEELLAKLVPAAQRKPDARLTMNIETRTRLVTEPDGLFPHGYWMEKVTEMSVTGARADSGMKQVQTQKVTYKYR
jgi:hypothetical protein